MIATNRNLIVRQGRRLAKGRLYLTLYHGRTHPDQQMDDWGFNGPIFGPLASVVVTYLGTIRVHSHRHHDALWLDTASDMVVWQGNYYGDFEVFVASPNDYA